MHLDLDPLQILILQVAAGVFIAAVGGTLAVVATIKAVRLAAQLGRQHTRRRRTRARLAEDQRIAAHIERLIDQRIVRNVEPVTEVLPILNERDLAVLARHELELGRRPLINRRYR